MKTGITQIRIISFILILLSVTVCFGQTNQGLSLAIEKYNTYDYESCVKICDTYISSNGRNNDPSIIEFYEYKALSLCKIASKESIEEAIRTLEKGLAIYKELDRDDATLVWFYNSFLNVAPTSHPSYRNHLLSLLCSKSCTIKDFQYYIDYMSYHHHLSDSKERKKALSQDELSFKQITNQMFHDYFLFVKGYILCGDGAYWANDEYVLEAEQCLNSAYKKMQNWEMDNYLSKYYFDTLEQLAEISEHKNKYMASSFYREQQLDVAEKYWKHWEVATPWSYIGPTSNTHSFQALPVLDNYINCLKEINDNQSILKAAKRVRNNPHWDMLSSKQKAYVLDLIDKF